MTKHAKDSSHLQAVDSPKAMAVEIPLPLLGVFGSIENSFSELYNDERVSLLQRPRYCEMPTQGRAAKCQHQGDRRDLGPDRETGNLFDVTPKDP